MIGFRANRYSRLLDELDRLQDEYTVYAAGHAGYKFLDQYKRLEDKQGRLPDKQDRLQDEHIGCKTSRIG